MSLEGSHSSESRKSVPLQPDLDDYLDTPDLHRRLLRLPSELRAVHLQRIEKLDDDEAAEYLDKILENREAATREVFVSDPSLREYFAKDSAKIYQALETDVFNDPDNILGRGQTARVKRFDLNTELGSPVRSMAIKYLVSPTEKTLSVSGEHDLISEVERIEKIEEAELAVGDSVETIRVPHPYFYYKRNKIQCYGMEEIVGDDLEDATAGEFKNGTKEEYREALKNLNVDALLADIDRFYDKMHTICLHGDVKPKNFMISKEGTFYVIDFGQSVLATQIDDKSQSAFENLKDEEKKNAKQAIRYFLNALNRD